MSTRPLHLCFICNELPPAPAGGIGPCVWTNAVSLAERGHRVVILGCYDRRYDWQVPGVQVYPIISASRRTLRPLRVFDPYAIRRHLRMLHRQEPLDLIEWPDFMGLYLDNIPGTVDVVRTHGPIMSHRLLGVAMRKGQWITEQRELRTLRRIPNWIGISRWFMDEWMRITQAHPRHHTVIYNPVDCALFTPGDPAAREDNLILYAGRLLERKGAFALAQAAKDFLRELPGARLLYLGADFDGVSRARIVELAGAEVASQIDFSDPVSQPRLAEIMRRCAVFAMPSFLESFGNVWAEAMASGTPVVGSRLSCGPEIVPDEQAGLLADPHDPRQITRAVVTLMRDAALRRRLGEQGRALAVERYSTTAMIPKTEQFYRECLADLTGSARVPACPPTGC